MKRKGILYVVILLLGLLMLSENHLNKSFGDYLFQFSGLSPWTDKDETGLHLPVLLGILLLIFGVSGAVKTFRPQFPRILSVIILCCIAFILICPIASEKTMFLLKHNSKGINSMDYSIKDSKCNFQTLESALKANCSFTIYNYGTEHEVLIKPILMARHSNIEIDVEEHVVYLPPHSRHAFSVQFEGTQRNRTEITGTQNKVGLELEVDGIRKKYE